MSSAWAAIRSQSIVPAAKCIDTLIPEGAAPDGAEHRIRDALHAWHEFDREQAVEAEDWRLLVAQGMANVRLYLRNVP